MKVNLVVIVRWHHTPTISNVEDGALLQANSLLVAWQVRYRGHALEVTLIPLSLASVLRWHLCAVFEGSLPAQSCWCLGKGRV